jgi:hypothetical protein
MKMQAHISPNLSGCVHRITGSWKGRVSAYYDAGGVLVDAEQILPNFQSRPVKRGGPIWNEVDRRMLPAVYAPRPVQTAGGDV